LALGEVTGGSWNFTYSAECLKEEDMRMMVAGSCYRLLECDLEKKENIGNTWDGFFLSAAVLIIVSKIRIQKKN
jgi:hypothetical protein